MALCANALHSYRVTHSKLTSVWVRNKVCHTRIELDLANGPFLMLIIILNTLSLAMSWKLSNDFCWAISWTPMPILSGVVLKNWPIRHTKLTNKVCVNRIGLTLFFTGLMRVHCQKPSNLTCWLFKKTTTDGNALLAIVRLVKKPHLKWKIRFGSRMAAIQ